MNTRMIAKNAITTRTNFGFISLNPFDFSILELLNGITELIEAIAIFKHKSNVMGVLFTIDAVFEVVLSILLIIEGQHALRTHVILISADLFFEGTIKLINQYVEDRKEANHQ